MYEKLRKLIMLAFFLSYLYKTNLNEKKEVSLSTS